MAEHRHIQFLRNEIIDVVENHQEAINNIKQKFEEQKVDTIDNTTEVEINIDKEKE
jgi:septum formation topological specificity factor MinE